jgi:hypothetical protein
MNHLKTLQKTQYGQSIIEQTYHCWNSNKTQSDTNCSYIIGFNWIIWCNITMGSICATQKSMFTIGQINIITIIMLNMTYNSNKLQRINSELNGLQFIIIQ